MKRHLLLPSVAGLLVAATGCTATEDDGRPDVVTAFYALEFVTEQIGGEHIDVTTLTQPGTEPHDLALSVAQTAQVIDADAVIYLAGFQAAVDEAVAQSESGQIIDATGAADLVTVDGAADPHFWLDPVRLGAVAVDVAEALTAVDPAHADAYATNLASLEARLEQLDEEFTTGLADCERDTVVVSHDAFGYLGLRYGLDLRAIAGLSPDAEPTPQHLAELHALIEDESITTVFSETLASPAMAEALSSDLGLRTEVLDPLEGLAEADTDRDYVSIMLENLAALQDANGCA
jgi:zinc transport system substrate-binding protein